MADMMDREQMLITGIRSAAWNKRDFHIPETRGGRRTKIELQLQVSLRGFRYSQINFM